jgi:hypothetical protein
LTNYNFMLMTEITVFRQFVLNSQVKKIKKAILLEKVMLKNILILKFNSPVLAKRCLKISFTFLMGHHL